MKTFSILACVMLGLIVAPAARATVSLAVSPASITNDFSGKIHLSIQGLTNGQQVQIKRFYDVNGNGAIDAGQDFVFQSFKVTDGQQPFIGGVRNLNVPGDDDGVTNGQITTSFVYPGLSGPASALTGNSIFKVEDQNGNALATQVFSVVQKVRAQGVRGQLISQSSGLPVTNSPVGLIDPNGSKNATVLLSDANGYFSFYAPTGSFALISLNSGYVSDENAGSLTVPSGQFITNNLSLISGAYTIAGTLTDASNGKPGSAIFVTVESTNHLFGGTFSDTNGYYSLPVTASQWKVKLDEAALAQKGYVKLQNSVVVTITNASVTNANFALPKANALVYGTVRDSSSNVVSGIYMVADDDQNLYEAIGLTGTNGAYTLGVLAGNWNAGPDNNALIAAGYSSGSSTNFSISAGQAVEADFILQSVSAHIRGVVQDNSGHPITNIQIVVQPYPLQGNGNNSLYPMTDSSGNFDVGVSAGTWNIALECVSAQNRGYVDVSGLNYTVTTGVDLNGLTLTFPQATATITGKVTDPVGNPVVGVTLDANQPISTNSSYFPGCVTTDNNGVYQILVLGGTWTVNVRTSDLNALGYDNISSTNVTIVAGLATANLIAPVTLTAPRFTSGGYTPLSGSTLMIVGDVAHTNTVQYSTNLVNWQTLTNRVLTNAVWQVLDPSAVGHPQRFYRVVAQP